MDEVTRLKAELEAKNAEVARLTSELDMARKLEGGGGSESASFAQPARVVSTNATVGGILDDIHRMQSLFRGCLAMSRTPDSPKAVAPMQLEAGEILERSLPENFSVVEPEDPCTTREVAPEGSRLRGLA